jgi:hypothetical protein
MSQIYRLSLVLLLWQCLVVHWITLPILTWIHLRVGRFYLCSFESFAVMRMALWADIFKVGQERNKISWSVYFGGQRFIYSAHF